MLIDKEAENRQVPKQLLCYVFCRPGQPNCFVQAVLRATRVFQATYCAGLLQAGWEKIVHQLRGMVWRKRVLPLCCERHLLVYISVMMLLVICEVAHGLGATRFRGTLFSCAPLPWLKAVMVFLQTVCECKIIMVGRCHDQEEVIFISEPNSATTGVYRT